MSKVRQELWLLLSLVVIAGLLNFLVSSQRVVLCFFFLPTLIPPITSDADMPR